MGNNLIFSRGTPLAVENDYLIVLDFIFISLMIFSWYKAIRHETIERREVLKCIMITVFAFSYRDLLFLILKLF